MKPATPAATPAAKKAAADTAGMKGEISKLAIDVQKLLELDDAIVSQNKGMRKVKGMYQTLLSSIKKLEMKSLEEVTKAKREEHAAEAGEHKPATKTPATKKAATKKATAKAEEVQAAPKAEAADDTADDF